MIDFWSDNNADRIYVKFDNEKDVKAFVYPECFGRFLKLEDPVLADQILDSR